MRIRFDNTLRGLILTPALLMGTVLFAQGTPKSADPTTPPTPTSSSSSKEQAKTDRDTMAKIRKSIVDDKTLSTEAHNVTIAAKDGKVSLKGKVTSEAERDAVVAKAKDVAGAENVTDNLTVSPGKTPKKTGE